MSTTEEVKSSEHVDFEPHGKKAYIAFNSHDYNSQTVSKFSYMCEYVRNVMSSSSFVKFEYTLVELIDVFYLFIFYIVLMFLKWV